MAETRPADDLVTTIAELRRELIDKNDTLMTRSNRRPVGTIEQTLRLTLAFGQLPLLGQDVSRDTYADLWEWAQTYSAVDGSIFGPGDDATTFTLPNLSGRFVVGAGTLGSNTYNVGSTGGSASKTLSTSEIPSHGGHTSGSFDAQSGSGVTIPNSFNLSVGSGSAFDIRPPFFGALWVVWF